MKKQIYQARMLFEGGRAAWLDVKKQKDIGGKEEIAFVRDKDGIHAWHCNSLPVSDPRILKIRKKKDKI
jgi:hypothetical protein